MGKIAIAGASGKLGFVTLNALLDHSLVAPSDIVCTTSSDSGAQKLQPAQQKGVEVRSANWDDQASFVTAFQGCEKLFLISSARVEMDFNDAPPGEGREADHFRALAAAKEAGVKHVYYSSLAFANPSLSRVMKAHERTEQYLKKSGFQWTAIREGLYNESWPLYFGHYDVSNDSRSEVPVGGNSKISWTSIPDLGLATALVLAAPSEEWAGKTFYLSQSKAHSLDDVAKMISRAKGKEVKLKVVTRPEHEEYYIKDRKMDAPFIKWWSKTYDALRENECEIHDPTLEQPLATKGRKPISMEETVEEMVEAERAVRDGAVSPFA
ncbi:hypothetical protein M409DRAFT_67335 [Zasmidium cellare ATCC 36951]|uniref:NmrA-like domain-containing protein n=1 Tax=Zasmidium cellare ATCC 36951 TaxID=1080233 RepID=A0A6A6CHX0_ZASCE|nr:uncharacterized protein M409DRAFT_67335 [Zasmidium cellare ATCC 36951]KAF2165552.1 hypothetical protein M409DRAFT_67335 [Zasmidium cellare ATCC 36951]